MKRLAPGVWRLKEFPRPTINVYLAGSVLIDAGRRWDRKRIFAELEGIEITEVALTHVHPDHQGCAKVVCDEREVPLACHADDVDAMEGRRPVGSGAAFIPRLYDLESGQGSIELDSVDVRDLRLEELRRAVVLVPQQPMLFRSRDRLKQRRKGLRRLRL